jgi:hypothetical protein
MDSDAVQTVVAYWQVQIDSEMDVPTLLAPTDRD